MVSKILLDLSFFILTDVQHASYLYIVYLVRCQHDYIVYYVSRIYD